VIRKANIAILLWAALLAGCGGGNATDLFCDSRSLISGGANVGCATTT
jgi:hypothetical protein